MSKEWPSLRVERALSPWADHQNGISHERNVGLGNGRVADPGHHSEACLCCGEMGGGRTGRLVQQVTPAHAGITEREFTRHTSAGVDFG